MAAAEGELRRLADAAGAELQPLTSKAPVAFSLRIASRLEAVCDGMGLTHRRLWSGAGHDAGVLAATTESGMIFVPSRRGVSHSAEEFTEFEDCVAGTEALLGSVIELDSNSL